jgi:uncharacterized membrane protein YbhN (UPF0104 family)
VPTFRRAEWSTIIVRGAVAAALLAALVAFVDPESIYSTARSAEILWIAAAIALLPANLYLESAKWRILYRQTSDGGGVAEAVRSVLAGYALGFVTPARLGDYAGRVLSLDETRKGSLLVLAAVDKLYSVWVYSAAGTIALALYLARPESSLGPAWLLTLGLGGVVTIVTAGVLVQPRSMYTIARSLFRNRWNRHWRRHFVAAASLRATTGLLVLTVSIVRFAVFSTQFVLLLLAFQPGISVAALYLGVILVFFVKTIVPSISLLDLGIRESAAVFFLGFLGVGASTALNAALLLFAVNVAAPALAGVFFVPGIEWTRWTQLRRKRSSIETEAG